MQYVSTNPVGHDNYSRIDLCQMVLADILWYIGVGIYNSW